MIEKKDYHDCLAKKNELAKSDAEKRDIPQKDEIMHLFVHEK